MDKIKFRCPGCGKAVNAPMAMAGKSAKHPSCGATITVPVPAPSATVQQAGAAQPAVPTRLSEVEDEGSSGPVVAEAVEEHKPDVAVLTEKERHLFAAFRSAVREYERIEQAERKRHIEFEQAKRAEMSRICAEAQRLFDNVASVEARAGEPFLVRWGWAPNRDSVPPGPVHGTSGAEFSRALTTCARRAQDQLLGVRSLPTVITVICGCAFVVFLVMFASRAGFALSVWVSIVAAALGSGLALYAGHRMCRAFYRTVRTAEAIRERWREGAQAYCEGEIDKSSEQARSILARQLDSWRQSLSRMQRAERAIVLEGDEIAPPWSAPAWTQWKPSDKKALAVRLGNYLLRAELSSGDYAGLSVPAIVPFPGDRCVMLTADSSLSMSAKRRYDVHLTSVGKNLHRVMEVIQTIERADERAENPDPDNGMPLPPFSRTGNLELDLMTNAPYLVRQYMSQHAAERLRDRLVRAGARVSLQPSQGTREQPDPLQLPAARSAAVQVMRSIATQLFAALPPGKVQFTFVDPVGLGESFAQFMDMKKYDDDLVTHRVWTEPRQIEQQLADLTQHMEDVIQMYLRNRYPTIEDYNQRAREIAEPYRVLMVADFPANFSEEAARRLVSIATNGPRCGVFAVIGVDTGRKLPYDFSLTSLERASTALTWRENGFVWQDSEHEYCGLQPDTPPDTKLLSHVIHEIGVRSKDAKQVRVPFQFVAIPEDRWWAYSARAGITIPLGKSGATDQHRLEFGAGTALHALICGKTGSGKTTLLHVLITNLALAYSPDELDLYLIDFKKGVEFKRYAAFELPHARVIAIETEREFGLSVLQGLNDELKRRGDLFRQAEVQNIAAYREKFPRKRCPRIILIVDEFQEFFVTDDQISHEAALVLDRLVRQGRAFGVHVILGTQTLAGAYSLARSTIDQMAIRIALQCSDADSRLILSDENSAARLLTRPGDAIYNNANGLIEGNLPFQVTWLADEESENYLCRIGEYAAKRGWKPRRPQIVFEGNAPASVEKNTPLDTLLSDPQWPELPKAVQGWIGEPIAIKDPTAAVFRRQTASNLVMVGQNEEAALGMMVTMAFSLAAQHDPRTDSTRARFYGIDLTPVDRACSGKLKEGLAKLPHWAQVGGRRELDSIIREVAGHVKDRMEDADMTPKAAVYLFLYGLQRARDLRQDDAGGYYDDNGEEPAPGLPEQFQTILRDGPEVGVHTVVWCDNWNNLDRTLARGVLREFDMRVAFQMSADDSSNLLDTPLASRLGHHRALFVTDEEGRIEKFRPYAWSDVWLERASRRLRAKPGTKGATAAQ